MGIIGFSHTGVQVGDIGRSIAFYETLGLEVGARWTNGEPYIGVEVGYPGVTLAIAVMTVPGSPVVLELLEYQGVERQAIDPGTANPATGHFCLAVEDLDGMYEQLLAAGVDFISPPQTPTIGPNQGGRVIYLRDPDGFRVELLQSPRSMVGEPQG
ncbi:MAG: VOC family protein [Actinobacteria bacterium]|nr:VOC family protein [Actinomycetota bacterium]